MNYTERDDDLSLSANFIINIKRINEKSIIREIYKILGGIK